MVNIVATSRGISFNDAEDGMTLEQIELAYHFVQRAERRAEWRSYKLQQAAIRAALADVFR